MMVTFGAAARTTPGAAAAGRGRCAVASLLLLRSVAKRDSNCPLSGCGAGSRVGRHCVAWLRRVEQLQLEMRERRFATEILAHAVLHVDVLRLQLDHLFLLLLRGLLPCRGGVVVCIFDSVFLVECASNFSLAIGSDLPPVTSSILLLVLILLLFFLFFV